MLRFRAFVFCLFLVSGAGLLQAQQITYVLTGSLQYSFGPDPLHLSGKTFTLTAQLTNLTPTFVTDPNLNARAEYIGTGTLQIGSLAPTVNRIDFSFADAKAGQNDSTGFSVRTSGYDFLFAPAFSTTANDVLAPPPTYPHDPVLFGSVLVAVPGGPPSDNSVYSFVNPTLSVNGAISSTTITYDVRAYIDGASVLTIQGNTLRWHNLAFYAPGKYVAPNGSAHNEPTVITSSQDGITVMNGYNWYPDWPNGIDGNQFSDSFVNLAPALPSNDVIVNLNVIRAHESVTAYLLPPRGNGTLAILFDDYDTAGADWYEAKISVTSLANSPVVNVDPVSGHPSVIVATAAGQTFHVKATGIVNLASLDGPYNVNADGVILAAPPLGGNADMVFTNYMDPVGIHPAVGGQKFARPYRGAAIVGAAMGDLIGRWDSGSWFGIGSNATIVAPSKGSQLSLWVNDDYYPDNSGSFTVTLDSSGPPRWDLISTQTEIARISMNMTFDSNRNVTVMFGGHAAGISLSDTWEYGKSHFWNRVIPLHSPPERFWASMAYDTSRKRTVLFGGRQEIGSSVTIFNDTWEYDGTDWSAITTPHSPPTQDALAMAYDSCRQKIVMFGTNGDTWEYDGSDWTQVHTSTSPPSRRNAALVYDPLRCRTILFGGGGTGALSDTWEYDGANWTQISTPISPSGRWCHAMAYDINRGRVVLFGGYGPIYPAGQPTNDTWEYDGSTWLQVFPHNSPSPSEQHAMAYDSTRQVVVMVQGSDTWEYTGAPPCPYSVAPTGQSFSAAAGMGSFLVSTFPSCGWNTTATVDWITILSGISQGTGSVNFLVATNTGAARSANIIVAGKIFNVSQQAYSCTYTIGPPLASLDNLGGNVSVSVSAPGGCSWTAVSNVGWLTIKSGASGSGGGVVILSVAPNTGGSRSGSATIAGKTFPVSQGAGACGALDVTSQMNVTRGGLTWIPFTYYRYSTGITVRNNSSSVIHGPVYLALIGQPTHNGYPNDSGLLGSQTLTTCFSSAGNYLLLVSGGDMQPGQTVGIPLVFSPKGAVWEFNFRRRYLVEHRYARRRDLCVAATSIDISFFSVCFWYFPMLLRRIRFSTLV